MEPDRFEARAPNYFLECLFFSNHPIQLQSGQSIIFRLSTLTGCSFAALIATTMYCISLESPEQC